MAEIVKSYIGVGKVHARAFGTTGKWRHVGNVSELAIKHNLDVQKQRDFTRAGGGTLIKVERIESIDCSMTWLTFTPENWALATAGTATTVAAGTVTDEVVKGYVGALVPLAFSPATITSVTNAAGAVTYDAGDDYVMTEGGISIPDGSSIVEAADLKVSYTYLEHTRIEGAMGTASELELLFEGLNEADSDKPVLVNLWRTSVPSVEEIALIGTTLGEMKFAGELLKDSTKGVGTSAFYRARMT